MPLEQFVPSDYCLKCDVCCRFLDEETPLAPVLEEPDPSVIHNRRAPLKVPYESESVFYKHTLVSYKDRFICRNFDPAGNNCKDYEKRPLDCQIYPFVVMRSENYKEVLLGVDPKCPYITDYRLPFTDYQNYLASALKDIDPKYILRFQDDIKILEKLEGVVPKGPTLNKLLIGDRQLFEKYARNIKNPLSNYSFVSNYVWTGLLDYYWAVIDGSFCLFCSSGSSFFMPIAPLGQEADKGVITKCFDLMNKENKNKNCSRIEDIPESGLGVFTDMGYVVKEKGQEYIYRQKDMADLAGDGYKDKRSLCNYFEKNYKFEYRKYSKEDKNSCIELFKRWQLSRVQGPATSAEGGSASGGSDQNDYYKALMEDSFSAHRKAMSRYNELGLLGRVIAVDGEISAYTFGYPLDSDTFVVLFEIADLDIKGLAQFIFREFCRELGGFEFINAMDDSGLENLKKTKFSYHPVKIERTFCACR